MALRAFPQRPAHGSAQRVLPLEQHGDRQNARRDCHMLQHEGGDNTKEETEYAEPVLDGFRLDVAHSILDSTVHCRYQLWIGRA